MIDEYSNIKDKDKDKNYIILTTIESKNNFALGIYINVEKENLCYYNLGLSFWGEMKYKDRKILIFGNQNTPFVSIKGIPINFFNIYLTNREKFKHKKDDNESNIINQKFPFDSIDFTSVNDFIIDDDCCDEYDPSFWYILINKQLELNVEKTHKLSEYDDISDIVDIAKKYFKVPSFAKNIIKQRVYHKKNIDDIYLCFDTPDNNYLKYGHVNADYEHDITILNDKKVIDTISVISYFELKYDTTLKKMPLYIDIKKINYDILNITINPENDEQIDKTLLEHLKRRIKKEFKSWKLCVGFNGFNVKNPIYRENRKTFKFKFIFIPSKNKAKK